MRFERVPGRPGTWLAYTCKWCGVAIRHGQEPAYTDVDGPPFKAYYHETCKDAALRSFEAQAPEGGK